MPKAARLQREGILPETDDPLVLELAKAWIKCCDELGVTGCDGCPVKKECYQLSTLVGDINHNLSLAEYRQFSQKFYFLKQERDRIMDSKTFTAQKGELHG